MLRTIYDATLTPRGARRGAQVCEEAPGQLEAEVPLGPKAERPSDALVPRLLALFGSPVEDAKCAAVAILNLLAGGMPQALADNMATCARPAPRPRLLTRLRSSSRRAATLCVRHMSDKLIRKSTLGLCGGPKKGSPTEAPGVCGCSPCVPGGPVLEERSGVAAERPRARAPRDLAPGAPARLSPANRLAVAAERFRQHLLGAAALRPLGGHGQPK
jgi:hypothetical protein